jgi:hypothetical protein
MAATASVVKKGYVATREVKYRYTCEHCGKQTDLFTGTYEEEYVSGTKPNVDVMLNFKQIDEKTYNTVKKGAEIVAEHLEKVFENYKKDCENGTFQGIVFQDNPFMTDNYNKMFKNAGKCPNCRKKQNWYPATHLKPAVAKRMFNWGLAFGILAIVVTFFVNSGESGKKVLPLALIFGGCGAVLGAIFGIIMHFAKKPKVNKKLKPSVPEIEWGEIVITDSDRVKAWTDDSVAEGD